MSITSEKCTVLSLGPGNQKDDFMIKNLILPHPENIRDLGVNISKNLKFSAHCAQIAKDAFTRCSRILRTFKTADKAVLLRLFITFVRPMLEYATPVFSPHYSGDTKKLESVQKYFTREIFKRCFPAERYSKYSNRLATLNIQTLEMRRVRADLIMCYKIVYNLVKIERDNFFRLKERGNSGRLLSLDVPPARYPLDCRRYSFANRTYQIWNELDESIVLSENVAVFRRNLDRVNLRTLKSCVFLF